MPRPSADRYLTDAEFRVLELAAQGRTNLEIAEQLVISSETVHSHLSHIYQKLGVRNRVLASSLLITLGGLPEAAKRALAAAEGTDASGLDPAYLPSCKSKMLMGPGGFIVQ